MKSLQKLSRLLLIVACAAPLLANASAINIARPNDYSFKKSNDIRASHDLRKKPVSSCCNTNNNGELHFLSTATNANTHLAQGTYQFGQFESSFNQGFADTWSFTLAKNSQVNLTLSNQDPGGKFSGLVDITNLQLKLFDGSNNLLGSTAGNHSLSLLLAADTQYSFLVSGNARGMLGGFYLGKLGIECSPTAVPIGGAFPMFAAALMLLGRKLRVRAQLR